MKQETVTTTVVTRKVTMIFDRETLLQRLKLPDDAEIFMQVPGGGDWSHTQLDVDSENRLYACYERVKTEEETST